MNLFLNNSFALLGTILVWRITGESWLGPSRLDSRRTGRLLSWLVFNYYLVQTAFVMGTVYFDFAPKISEFFIGHDLTELRNHDVSNNLWWHHESLDML